MMWCCPNSTRSSRATGSRPRGTPGRTGAAPTGATENISGISGSAFTIGCIPTGKTVPGSRHEDQVAVATTAAGAATSKRVHYQVTFAVLCLGAMSYSLLQSLVIPALPSLEHSLHASADAVAWILTAYLLSAAIATPILGRVGDMLGKERLLLIVLLVLSVGTLISGLATSLPVMLVGRVIQGAGGAVFPLSFGIIRDEFPEERVVGAIGFLSSVLG